MSTTNPIDLPAAQQGTEYRPIADWPGYAVGDDGSVWTAWKRTPLPGKMGTRSYISAIWRKLKPWTHRFGYPMVTLSRDKKLWRVAVHSLVLLCFVGPCPPEMECCHEDDDPKNPALTNLKYGTHQSNMEDAAKRKRMKSGAQHPMVKLTPELTAEIKRRVLRGERKIDIVNALKISRSSVWKVDKGHSWMDS